jgi:hypothetical protein
VGLFKLRPFGRRFGPSTRRGPDRRVEGFCDSCGDVLHVPTAYYLVTSDVVRSESYWLSAFDKQKSGTSYLSGSQQASLFGTRLRLMAGQGSPWSICESCSDLFVFDRDVARSHAEQNSTPPHSGPVEMDECVVYAAAAWERVFGYWPAGVAPPTIVGSCGLCRKNVYLGEVSTFVPAAQMERLRQDRIVDREPVSAPQPDGDDMGWTVCLPCVARQLGRQHRRSRPA